MILLCVLTRSPPKAQSEGMSLKCLPSREGHGLDGPNKMNIYTSVMSLSSLNENN